MTADSAVGREARGMMVYAPPSVHCRMPRGRARHDGMRRGRAGGQRGRSGGAAWRGWVIMTVAELRYVKESKTFAVFGNIVHIRGKRLSQISNMQNSVHFYNPKRTAAN